MKQALHIFLKDVRRLWLHIAAVMIAIAYFAVLDVRWSTPGMGSGTLIIEFIVSVAVWFLIARAVHEESLPGENQFWLTRPYERCSLLGSKIMMAVCVVIVPLFVADYAILSAQSLEITGNLVGLALRQLVTAAWLILPPFAIASVTRTITEDVMVWLVGIAIAGVAYIRTSAQAGGDRFGFLAANVEYSFAIGVVLMIAALCWQYRRRATTASRALMAVLSPVYKWAPLGMDGRRLRDAIARGGQIEFTPREANRVAASRSGCSRGTIF